MLNERIEKLSGVGEHIAHFFTRLNVHTIGDLLLHLPFRYEDRGQITPIKGLKDGLTVGVSGQIVQIETPKRTKTKLICRIHDNTGILQLRFFHVPGYLLKQLTAGTEVYCYGTVRLTTQGLEICHPELILNKSHLHTYLQQLMPVYATTDGLSQYLIRKFMHQALQRIAGSNLELLSRQCLAQLQLPEFKQALQIVHKPALTDDPQLLNSFQHPAQKRLVFEELLAHRLLMRKSRQIFQQQSAPVLTATTDLQDKFLQTLPFHLTAAQQRVMDEIAVDLQQPMPMLRLVQGDVGSGKTLVALLAMLQAVAAGYQAALMAPTELLAEQHAKNFQRWLESINITMDYLSGSQSTKRRREALASIASGTARIVIGTHALFQEQVEFQRLGLVVIDEQHRFGVQQRAQLRNKGCKDNLHPHQLVMTATPIPRTLAMSVYADLDVSVIDELPPGRSPITTTVLLHTKRDEIITKLAAACSEGKQVYWVCPLIDESEAIQAQAATLVYAELQQSLPDIAIGLVHGRMSSAEKDQAMQAFQHNKTKILVATTVIEVGVDVPNASIMVIENAERLGLAQLHQLRGRVGRGTVASHCILLYQYPLSKIGKERLAIMRATQDGFAIAQRDLELRGPGEVLGTKQTGSLVYKIADLLRDCAIIPSVQQFADHLLTANDQSVAKIISRWQQGAEVYCKV